MSELHAPIMSSALLSSAGRNIQDIEGRSLLLLLAEPILPTFARGETVPSGSLTIRLGFT